MKLFRSIMYIFDAPDLGENKAYSCILFVISSASELLNEALYDIEERITMSIESLQTILDYGMPFLNPPFILG